MFGQMIEIRSRAESSTNGEGGRFSTAMTMEEEAENGRGGRS